MENIKTIETAEVFDDSVFDSENFPVKDRSRSVRRKKTYFKGKNRLSRICKTRQYSKKESIDVFNVRTRGMLKKTNVVTPHFHVDDPMDANVKDMCRDLDTKEMFADYYEEAI